MLKCDKKTQGSLYLFSKCSQMLAKVLNLVVICLWVDFINDNQRKDLLKGDTDFQDYVTLQNLIDVLDIYKWFNVVNIVFQTIYGIRFFQVTNAGEAVYIALANALPVALSYLPMYFMALSGFALAGMFLFGLSHAEWSTYGWSFFTVFEINFGLYDIGPLWETTDELGRGFLCLANIFFIPILLNIFLAIIINAWDDYVNWRAAFGKAAIFGIREISLLQTFEAVVYRVPIVAVRNHLTFNYEKDFIELDDFVEECESLKITGHKRDILLDWFWPAEMVQAAVAKKEEKHTHENDDNKRGTTHLNRARQMLRNLQITSTMMHLQPSVQVGVTVPYEEEAEDNETNEEMMERTHKLGAGGGDGVDEKSNPPVVSAYTKPSQRKLQNVKSGRGMQSQTPRNWGLMHSWGYADQTTVDLADMRGNHTLFYLQNLKKVENV